MSNPALWLARDGLAFDQEDVDAFLSDTFATSAVVEAPPKPTRVPGTLTCWCPHEAFRGYWRLRLLPWDRPHRLCSEQSQLLQSDERVAPVWVAMTALHVAARVYQQLPWEVFEPHQMAQPTILRCDEPWGACTHLAVYVRSDQNSQTSLAIETCSDQYHWSNVHMLAGRRLD